MSDDHRLERIENKLDEVGKAIVALARMEERMITLFKRMDTLDNEQSAQERRLSLVENRVGSNGQSLRFAERLFWIIATAAVGLIFFKMRSGG
jgi:hypothetical protein|tara:strand:- start:979 stop:1257 length:279 start_codon:yes stop_codon:yes gene_type:complete